MFWLKLLKSIISILHSNTSPKQIARGVVLGAIFGLTPFFCLHNLFLFLILILFKINITTVLLCAGIFGIIGHFTDLVSHQLGYLLLVKANFLTSLWTWLYNLPLVPFTKFNNTVVFGSILISLILILPLYIFSKKFIVYYRANLQSKVENTKLMYLFKLTKVYKFYQKLR